LEKVKQKQNSKYEPDDLEPTSKLLLPDTLPLGQECNEPEEEGNILEFSTR